MTFALSATIGRFASQLTRGLRLSDRAFGRRLMRAGPSRVPTAASLTAGTRGDWLPREILCQMSCATFGWVYVRSCFLSSRPTGTILMEDCKGDRCALDLIPLSAMPNREAAAYRLGGATRWPRMPGDSSIVQRYRDDYARSQNGSIPRGCYTSHVAPSLVFNPRAW